MIKAARLLFAVLSLALVTTACSSDALGPDTGPVNEDAPWMGGGNYKADAPWMGGGN